MKVVRFLFIIIISFVVAATFCNSAGIEGTLRSIIFIGVGCLSYTINSKMGD